MTDINIEELKQELKYGLTDYVEKITTKDKRLRDKYVCPICNSGGSNSSTSDGAFSIQKDDPTKWKCFACGNGGDIYNLIHHVEGIESLPEQINRARDILGRVDYTKALKNENRAPKEKEPIKGKYKNYIDQCKKNVSQTDYFMTRGFTTESIERFNLGYDDKINAIVIPYNLDYSYYMTRSVDVKSFKKPTREEAGAEPVYNVAALYSDDRPIFVCESPLDAISIMQQGAKAIAVGGTGHRKLISAIEKQKPTGRIILSFDNDDPGKSSTDATAEELERLEIPYMIASYRLDSYTAAKKDAKDPNDFMVINGVQFNKDIKANIKESQKLDNAEHLERLEEHSKSNAYEILQKFKEDIKTGESISYISTGFNNLNTELDGGLYPGLYILGAISSLGKTTLILQMADNIAQQGKDVLYFSLEMGATELISKSLSRHTHVTAKTMGKEFSALRPRDIETSSKHKHFTKEKQEYLQIATDLYSSYAKHLYIYEGIGDIGIDQITKLVEKHIELTGNTPVVFIDYLQILAPHNDRASDKQNIDKAVLELKRLSRDHKTPVVAISSFNRDSYTNEVSLASFKESGAIEYGSDVLIALQPHGMKRGKDRNEQAFNVTLTKETKKDINRKIDAVILKNRHGRTEGKIGFVFHAMYSHFTENYDFDFTDEELTTPFNKEEFDRVI